MRAIVWALLTFGILSSCKTQESITNVPAESHTTFSEDGAWCWFSDPRAVHLNGKVYSGWVSTDGSIMVASYNEHTGETKEVNIFSKFNKDDHANPSFLILPDKRIMVFFSAHSTLGREEKEGAITYATSKNPEDITEWDIQKRLTKNAEGPRNFCYTNPVMLSEESNRIYIFWRGGDWKPTFCYTDDFGKTWSNVFSLIKSSENNYKRPYVKLSSNGKDEIHFAFTDGHPRGEALNNIYYLKYKAGEFYRANGDLVGTMESLPIEHEKCDMVYDAYKAYIATRNGVRAWIWDVAFDSEGTPVIAYAKLPEETNHEYWYAKWDGEQWINSKITSAGSYFPRYQKLKEAREPEPHYSGGVYIDHEDVNVVYYSRAVGDIFEIFKGETMDDGQTWKEIPITSKSEKDNVRPFAIRGAGDIAKSQVMWMYNENYSHYKVFNSRIKIDGKR
jgi:hypothetical protein